MRNLQARKMLPFLLSLVIAFLIAAFVEVVIYNSLWVCTIFAPKRDLSLSDFSLKDFQAENGKLVALSSDPNIEVKNLHGGIYSLKIVTLHSAKNYDVQVFFSDGKKGYSQDNSVTEAFSQPKSTALFDIPEHQTADLRLDLTDIKGDQVTVQSIRVNQDVPFLFHIKVPLFAFIVSFLLILLIWTKKLRPAFHMVVRYRYPLALAAFILLVFFKVSGSSIGIWDSILLDKVDAKQTGTIVGQARAIRSDEWLAQTPTFLAQANATPQYPVNNPNIGNGQNMLVGYGDPVSHPSIIGRPYLWGFLLLGPEYGLAWYWWSKLILLILVSFEFSMLITKRNEVVSSLAGLWIGFAPAVQWWFSAFIPELLVDAMGIIVCVYYYLYYPEKKRRRILMVALGTILAAGFALPLYPPWQFPLLYFTGITCLILFIRKRKNIVCAKYEWGLLAASVLVIGFSEISYLKDGMQAMKAVMNTVYPGERQITGGNGLKEHLFPIMDNWLLPFKSIDTFWKNNCEASMFFSFFPISIPVAVYAWFKKEKEAFFPLVWSALLLFFLSWEFVRYPAWLARITLMSYVTEQRLMVIIGFLGVLIDLYALAYLIRKRPFHWWQIGGLALFYTALAAFCCRGTFVSDYLHANAFTFKYVLVAVFVLCVLFLIGSKIVFPVVMAALVCISGMTVNPLEKGLEPIYNKVTSQEILKLNREDPGRWAVIDQRDFYGNLLIALGSDSINSVQYVPQIKMWETLDTEKKYSTIYNRYAHVGVKLGNASAFQLVGKDHFDVTVSVADLKKLQVHYVMATSEQTNTDLSLLYKNALDNVYIYELK